MQIYSSAINLVNNANKDTASMRKDWLGALPKFNKMIVGLIHDSRNRQWQTLGSNKEIIGHHHKILSSE